MIRFVYDPAEETARQLRDALLESCLAWRDDPRAGHDPVLYEEDRETRGARAIMDRIGEIVRYKAEWDRFQSDACYIEEDGSVC